MAAQEGVRLPAAASARLGVDHVLAFPGDGINGILAAWARADDDPMSVQSRPEEMSAFEAVGYAKFTGRLGVCMATSGPGAIHLLEGLYDVKLDHVPVVAIVGQTNRSAMGGSYPLIWQIYPVGIGSKAMSVFTLGSWAANYLVAATSLTLGNLITGQGIFFLYAATGVGAFVVFLAKVPETKDRTLGQIQDDLNIGGDQPTKETA